jgi:hypothetical protein
MPPSTALCLRPSQRSNDSDPDCPFGVWVYREGEGGGGAHGPYLAQVRNRRGQTRHPTVLAINPPLQSFPRGLSFAFLLAAARPSLDKILDGDVPNNAKKILVLWPTALINLNR